MCSGWISWCRAPWSVAALLAFSLGAGSASAWDGFYVDAEGYAPGESIAIHGSSPGPTNVYFRLLRSGAGPDGGFTEIARSATIGVTPQPTDFGSFVEVPTVDMAGMATFTLEGWFYPTMVGGDDVVLAGQLGSTMAGAALLVTADGRPAAYVGSAAAYDAANLVVAPGVLAIDAWHHLAATYDGASLRLYVDGVEAATGAASGAVADAGLPFRIGARAEAPGDLTGIADGRFDSWALWPGALDLAQIGARMARGMTEVDPMPPPASVLFYFPFDDGAGGAVAGASTAAHAGTVAAHGRPGIAGVFGDGRALGLHHDQVVDAGWPVTVRLDVPSNAPSGLYAVQAVIDSDEADRSPDLFIATVIRPTTPTPGARIAVIVPVNTWNAYNTWPAVGVWDDVPTPGITSRARTPGGPVVLGGNNSAYRTMGDGVSPGFFPGWRRPSQMARILSANATGYSNGAFMAAHLSRWLEEIGLPYDVFTDRDLDAGRVPVGGPYRVLIFQAHHEYWSRGMLDATHAFAQAGGSILNLGGNVLTWRMAHGAGGVSEVRKWPTFDMVGPADALSAVDGERIGLWRAVERCRDGQDDYVLGTTIHLIGGPCEPADRETLTCHGQWSAMNVGHWLWEGITVAEGGRFGVNELGANIVGHEADTWFPGHLPPGILSGTTPVVLARGVNFGGRLPLLDSDAVDALSCDGLVAAAGTGIWGIAMRTGDGATESAGNILYHRHEAGGRVLSVAAIATSSGLGFDATLTPLVRRALDCFALETGCGDGPVVGVDAGIGGDAGAPMDAGSGADAGSADAGTGGDDGGCSCRVGAAGRAPTFALLVLALVGLRRRRGCFF